MSVRVTVIRHSVMTLKGVENLSEAKDVLQRIGDDSVGKDLLFDGVTITYDEHVSVTTRLIEVLDD